VNEKKRKGEKGTKESGERTNNEDHLGQKGNSGIYGKECVR